MYEVQVIPTDSEPRDEIIEKGNVLKGLQTLVGGYIETVPVLENPDIIMIVNEEGLIHGLPFNMVASQIARQQIVGTAVLVPVEMLDDE